MFTVLAVESEYVRRARMGLHDLPDGRFGSCGVQRLNIKASSWQHMNWQPSGCHQRVEPCVPGVSVDASSFQSKMLALLRHTCCLSPLLVVPWSQRLNHMGHVVDYLSECPGVIVSPHFVAIPAV